MVFGCVSSNGKDEYVLCQPLLVPSANPLTVDLCQNPLTKEPKLVRARQIPEWDSYDREIAAFAKRVEGKTGKGMAASVDALAGDGKEVESSYDESIESSSEVKGRIEDEL